MANLNKIVYLSEEQKNTLFSEGTITVGGQTVTYNENDVYMTPLAPLSTVAYTGSYLNLVDTPTIDAAPTQDSTNLVTSGGVYNMINANLTAQYNATLISSNWVGTGPYTYSLSLTDLACGADGSVSPIIAPASNKEEYNYITDAQATPGTGIVFTASTKPTEAIGIIIIDNH